MKEVVLSRFFVLPVAVVMLVTGIPVGFADDGMVEIEVELPEPFFGGTPLDYWGPNLEPPSFKDPDPFMAPEGTKNVALNKEVTSSAPPYAGELEQLVDGDKDYGRNSVVELPEGLQWVQVDLEESHDIYAIALWHFHEGSRVYFDIVIRVSDDPDFAEYETVYNNDHDNSSGLGVGEDKEYIESHRGRVIEVEGVSGRYVRLYSNGNTANDMNHYIEVEVFGVPSK